ncbi:MAG: alpha/beta hydrolase [Sinobacteraceae bacterium]|nr:alpha/beta hydrolase [Nevskiaceae bacterium]
MRKSWLVGFEFRVLALLVVSFSMAGAAVGSGTEAAPVPRIIKTGDIDTYVLDYAPSAPGKPILLLHGGFGSTRLWEGVAKELSPCHRVIVPDMRGRGRTALGEQSLSPKQLANDTFLLLDALGISAVHAIGHSAGSIALLQMLQQHPDRILTASLVGSPAMVIGETSGPMADLTADLNRLAAGQDAIDPTLNQFREQWKRLSPEPHRFTELASRLTERQSFEIDPADSAGKRPVMVIRAGKDPLIPPSGFDRLAQRVRADRVEDFPDGTHQLPRQHASGLAAAITTFIEQSEAQLKSDDRSLSSLPPQCR